ncbi:Thioredoxin-like superfamily [Sesbania bispinosa]|nr:Thioredoxin-like superfamily [Sesbania bispinosa]
MAAASASAGITVLYFNDLRINSFKKVPAIVDGRFKLVESHAILIYLASAFPGVPDH